MATLGNPKNTIEILQKYQFVFQKKFGQNFLIDTHVLEKIIAAAGVTKDDCVLEIGPGIGTMTPCDRRGDRPEPDPDPEGHIIRLRECHGHQQGHFKSRYSGTGTGV